MFEHYRIQVSRLFPYESQDPERPGMVHVVVIGDTIHCSRECFMALQALPQGDGSEHNHFAARPLDDEEVWLRAWCAAVTGGLAGPRRPEDEAILSWADHALQQFRKRFPHKKQ